MASEQDVLTRLGGRKFVAFVLALVAAVLAAGLMPGGLSTELSAAIVGLVAVFSGANAMSTISAIKNASAVTPNPALDAKLDSEVTKAEDLTNVQLDRIENDVKVIGASVNQLQNFLVSIVNSAPKR